MEIKPFFETTLTSDFQGKYLHKAGAKVAYAFELQTKKFGVFHTTAYSPSHFALAIASELAKELSELELEINSSKNILYFSNKNLPGGLTDLEVIKIDPEAKIIRKLDEGKIYEYIKLALSLLLHVVIGVENYVNMSIPDDYIHSYTNKKGKITNLSKDEIVKLSLDRKIVILARSKGLENQLRKQGFWLSFIQTKRLRNDGAAHLKVRDRSDFRGFKGIQEKILDYDYSSAIKAAAELLSYLEQNQKYIEI